MFAGDYIDELISDIYRGKYSLKKLPKSLYEAYVKTFNKAYDDVPTLTTKLFDQSIYKNIRLFSGAKTFQYSYSTIDLLYVDGKVVPFDVFKENAKQIFKQYNETYLKTEYGFAQSQAELIQTWNEETEVNDYLEYVAVLDSKTSDICSHLDGIIRKKSDSFWVTHSPLNHYRCRCTLIGADGETPSTKAKVDKAIKDSNVPKDMQYNAALMGKVFSPDHAYFTVPKLYKGDLKKNFGL